MTAHYGLILDSLIVVLLIATIVYAAMLNRRLAGLRDNRRELEQAVRSFSEAAARADAGIKGLKRAAEETGQRLQKDVDRGEALKDELTFLVETAEALCARLEAGAGGRRAARPAEASAAAPERAASAGARTQTTAPAARAPGRDDNGVGVRPAAKPAATGGEDVLRAIETLR